MTEYPTIGTDLAVIDTEIAEIETSMADTNGDYWHDPTAQARYRDLTEAREAQAVVPVTGAKASRLATIESMMADTTGPYWKGADSERLQAEYRALLEGGMPDASPARATPEPPAGSFEAINNTPLGVDDMAANWGESDAGAALMDKLGDDFEQFATDAQNAAADYLAGVPAKARDQVVAMFDKLPDGMKFNIIEGLAGIGARFR